MILVDREMLKETMDRVSSRARPVASIDPNGRDIQIYSLPILYQNEREHHLTNITLCAF